MKTLRDLVGKNDKETISNMCVFIKEILADHQKTISDYNKVVEENMKWIKKLQDIYTLNK